MTRISRSLAAAIALLLVAAVPAVASPLRGLSGLPGGAGPIAEDDDGGGTTTVVEQVLESVADGGGPLVLENSFVSATGWVKPGDSYPFRVLVSNPTGTERHGVTVTLEEVAGMSFTDARSSTGDVTNEGGTITWTFDEIGPGTEELPATVSLVVEAAAAGLDADPEVVWKNLSTLATLTYDGGPDDGVAASSHGPKVIPPDARWDTARYGDRPFPVVPIDYADFQHREESSAEALDDAINGRDNPGSTFNLYQEMSLGQLFPEGTVPSVGIEEAPVEDDEELRFSTFEPGQTCTGVTLVDPTTGAPAPTYTTRIQDGWYQLPGTRNYYGQDGFGSAVVGSQTGVGALQQIDSGCGPTAKAAYDAAVVADPDIDYSDYDTDKDGVVDFFEVVFQGQGGNGVSQGLVCDEGPADPGRCPLGEGTAPYDNIWPHSSSLEFSYTDEATGLTGYISDDQLKDLEGNPLWYTDGARSQMTTDDMGEDLVVYVRVGPYNVNPETAIDKASVISHEYGHSLGLPDFYSTGNRDTYGDFTLMATDKSQHMDVFSKQELGWIVPRVLEPGQVLTAENWPDSKTDVGEIHWQTPDGTPYVLSAENGDAGIHNAVAYVASLPGRQLLDESKLGDASPTHVWHSGSGNDFGCAPEAGHNLDIPLPQLADLPADTPVTVTFNSYWDIEWDYDYGFVLTGTSEDGGSYEYTSHPSANGYTTDGTQNPNANSCMQRYGNGLTGSSGAYAAHQGTLEVDRVLGEYYEDESTFVPDEYDISSLAGQPNPVLRFSYATDPGLARPGWFIDDVTVTAGDEVIFESDVEEEDERFFPGGCREDLTTADRCTDGWARVQAGGGSTADHAYYLEMRDRSGFDNEGQDENDRAPIEFEAGLLLTYTDEAHGYGNVGTDNPPAQSPLDSQPTPGEDSPDLSDATFTAGEGDGAFSDSGDGHIDNYSDPDREPTTDKEGAEVEAPWLFDYDCLTFTVESMSGDTTLSDTSPGDLRGDVAFDMGDGCAEYDYGFGAPTGAEAPAEPADDGDTPEPEPGAAPAQVPAVVPPARPSVPAAGPPAVVGTEPVDPSLGAQAGVPARITG